MDRATRRGLEQGPLSVEIIRQDTTVVDEGHRDQEAAEEPARDEDQRQDAADLAVLVAHHQIEGSMSKGLLHYPAPAHELIPRGHGVAQDVAIPRDTLVVGTNFRDGDHAGSSSLTVPARPIAACGRAAAHLRTGKRMSCRRRPFRPVVCVEDLDDSLGSLAVPEGGRYIATRRVSEGL